MKKTGMVVKITGGSCILLTGDGEYKKIALPENGVTRVGQIIPIVGKKNRFPYLKHFMVAASLLLIVLTGQLYLGRTQPAAAFMTIDINPSIELAILADKRVSSARGLNDDGATILKEIKVTGLDLHEAAKLIVDQAIKDQFFTAEDGNIILVTLTTDDDENFAGDLESIYESIKSPVELNGLESEVIIEPVDTTIRQEAEKAGISTGRYLLLQKSANKGITVNVDEISAMSFKELEKEKKISISDLLGNGNNRVNINRSSINNRNSIINRDSSDNHNSIFNRSSFSNNNSILNRNNVFNNNDIFKNNNIFNNNNILKNNSIFNRNNDDNSNNEDKNRTTEKQNGKNIYEKQRNTEEDNRDRKDNDRITGKGKTHDNNDKRTAPGRDEKRDNR